MRPPVENDVKLYNIIRLFKYSKSAGVINIKFNNIKFWQNFQGQQLELFSCIIFAVAEFVGAERDETATVLVELENQIARQTYGGHRRQNAKNKNKRKEKYIIAKASDGKLKQF